MGNLQILKFVLVLVYILQTASVRCATPPICAQPVKIYGDDCSCYEVNPNVKELWCKNISCFREFTSYLEQMQGYNVTGLSMVNIDVKFISEIVFDRDFKRIEVFTSVFEKRLFEEIPEDSNITHLHLDEVKIADGKWDWQYISPLKLENLVLKDIPLGGLQNFTHFKNTLTHIVLYGCDVKKLQDDQFREYTKLQMIDIRHDSLDDLKSSMFPPQIKMLIFRYNHLTSLREDLFVGLEHLDLIDIEENRLTVLTENTYRPIFNSVVFMMGNPLNCDCRTAWMSKKLLINAICESPAYLKGRDTKNLPEEDFSPC